MAAKDTEQVDLPIAAVGSEMDPAHRQMLAELALLPRATVFVARKVNLGNYENIDFSMTMQVPLGMTEDELEVFNDYANRALEQGLGIVITEIASQTEKVKAQRRSDQSR